MRILHVNKFLYRKGGAEAYMEDVAALQAAAGHEIAFFGMAHPSNPPYPYADHFPPHIELEPPPPSAVGKAKAIGRMLWSTSAARGMKAVLDDFRPDVVHLHNVYHQLSPSILRPLGARGVPAVMTLHDYKLVCPTYQMLDHGRVCDACVGSHTGSAVLRRCKDDSLLASGVAAVELGLHRSLGAYDPVQFLICPSRFLADTMRRGGLSDHRLRHVPHFVEPSDAVADGPRSGVLFTGRLSYEKGIDVLVHAVAAVDGAVLTVAGDGPDRSALEELAARVAPGRVTFLGRVPKSEVQRLLGRAALVAVPSRWNENQPMSVLEAFAASTPVVASTLGGLPELVRPGLNGALVPPDDAAALAAAISSLLADPEQLRALGTRAREEAEVEFSPSRHLDRLDALYAEAASERRVAA